MWMYFVRNSWKTILHLSGNKADLICPDQKGYLQRFEKTLRKYCIEYGFHKHFNVLGYSLISAKNRYGVENLITVCLNFAKNIFEKVFLKQYLHMIVDRLLHHYCIAICHKAASSMYFF